MRVEPVASLLEALRLGHSRPPAAGADAWRSIDVAAWRRLVEFEECELWLYRRLKDRGILELVDERFAAWLAARARDVTAHNMLVDGQIVAVATALNELGIPHVFIKGAARRLLAGNMPYVDARGMSDIDVLVPAHRVERAWDHFTGAGFDLAFDRSLTPEGHYHLPSLVDDTRVVVELHTSTSNAIDPAEAWRRQTEDSRTIAVGDGTTTVPSPTELFWHAMTHGLRHGPPSFRLRFLLDLATVWASGCAVDWARLERRLRDEVSDPAGAALWLGAASTLLAERADGPFADFPADHLERLLRWRLAVFERYEPTARSARRLLVEGALVEFGWPRSPTMRGTSLSRRARRRTATSIARGLYLTWRRVNR